MKKLQYVCPSCMMVALSTADLIAASVAFLDEDGVIELTAYGFGENGGYGE